MITMINLINILATTYVSTASNLSDMFTGFFMIPLLLMSFVFSFILQCVFPLIFVALLVLWIISLLDVVQRDENDFPNPTKDIKLIWILIIILSGGVGSVIYYFMVYKPYPRKIKKTEPNEKVK